MKMIFVRMIIFFPFVFLLLDAKAQSILYPTSSPFSTSARFGAKVTSAMTTVSHPATITLLHDFSATAYAEKKFLATGLNLLTVAAALRFGHNGLSVWYRYFGTSPSYESAFGLSYGISLGKIKLGSLLGYNQFRYGSDNLSILTYGLSSLIQLSDKVTCGIHLFNPQWPAISNNKRPRPPAKSGLGLGVQVSDQLYIGCEGEKTEGITPFLSVLLHYEFSASYYAKSFWNSLHRQPYFSLGWHKGNATIEIGSGFHEALGMSPAITFIYQQPAK